MGVSVRRRYAGEVAKRLEDRDTHVRRAAAESLGKMGEQGARYAGEVVNRLEDRDSWVRRFAAKALGRISDVYRNI